MGGCSNKNSLDSEVESSKSMINDRMFLKKIDLTYIDALKFQSIPTSILRTTRSQIQQDIFWLKQMKSEILPKKIQPKNQSLLVIDIQKAKNVSIDAICISDVKVFIEIEFFPLKKQIYSKAVNVKLPVWYKLIEFYHPYDSIEKLCIRMFCLKSFNLTELVGEVCIPYERLKNEYFISDWFNLEGGKALTVPNLMLKLQLIKTPIKDYQEFLDESKKTSKILKDSLLQCELILEKRESEL